MCCLLEAAWENNSSYWMQMLEVNISQRNKNEHEKDRRGQSGVRNKNKKRFSAFDNALCNR